jgi:hypothetical protein
MNLLVSKENGMNFGISNSADIEMVIINKIVKLK